MLDTKAATSNAGIKEELRGVARYVRREVIEICEKEREAPELTDDDVLEIVAGRHPVVEQTLRGEPFTPNDLLFNSDERILVITGPNMAGKSVYLRQNALIVLMAQMGGFVPADRARIGNVDRIFTRVVAWFRMLAVSTISTIKVD